MLPFNDSVPNNNEVYTAQTEQCSLDFKSESIKTNVYFEWFARQYTKNNYSGQSPFNIIHSSSTSLIPPSFSSDFFETSDFILVI